MTETKIGIGYTNPKYPIVVVVEGRELAWLLLDKDEYPLNGVMEFPSDLIMSEAKEVIKLLAVSLYEFVRDVG